MDSKGIVQHPPLGWWAVSSLWGQGSRTCVPRTARHCHQGFRGNQPSSSRHPPRSHRLGIDTGV